LLLSTVIISKSAHHSIYTASRTHKEKTMTKAIEVNCTTGEVTERDLTAEEIAAQEAAQAQAEADRAAAEAEATAKAAAKASANAKLKALGLSDAEIAALS
jgi:hypothetical protein